MSLAEDRTNAVELVRRGFADATGVLAFRVVTDVIGAAEALEAIGARNGFDPAVVVPALRRVSPHVWRISVGREYSPVLYLELEDGAAAAEVIAAMRDAAPDECAIVPGYFPTVRAWWD